LVLFFSKNVLILMKRPLVVHGNNINYIRYALF